MKHIWSVAKLTFRLPFRGGGGVFLLAFCGLVSLVLYLVCQSDGELLNEVRVRATYALSFGLTALSMSLLWFACLSMRGDIEQKRLHLLTSYPLPRPAIYLGKWLGLFGFGCLGLLVILTVVGICCWLQIQRWPDPEAQAQARQHFAHAKRLYQPLKPNVKPRVDAEIERLMATGQFPPDRTEWDLRDELTKLYTREFQGLEPNRGQSPPPTKTWDFDLGGPPPASVDTVTLKVRYYSRNYDTPIAGAWRFSAPAHPEQWETTTNEKAATEIALAVPTRVIPADGRFQVTFENRSAHELTFYYSSGLELEFPGGSVPANYAKALGWLLFHLAAVIAVGLTVAVAFTLSVAAFSSLVLYLLAVAAPFFDSIVREIVEYDEGRTNLVYRLGEFLVPLGLMFTTGLERPAIVDNLVQALVITPDNLGMLVTRRFGGLLLAPVELLSESAFAAMQSAGVDLFLGLGSYLLIVVALGLWLLARKELDRVH